MKVLKNWSEIPLFESEADEARFWSEHQLDARLMNGSILKADSRESTTVTLVGAAAGKSWSDWRHRRSRSPAPWLTITTSSSALKKLRRRGSQPAVFAGGS